MILYFISDTNFLISRFCFQCDRCEERIFINGNCGLFVCSFFEYDSHLSKKYFFLNSLDMLVGIGMATLITTVSNGKPIELKTGSFEPDLTNIHFIGFVSIITR
jgi:hypothetical protein